MIFSESVGSGASLSAEALPAERETCERTVRRFFVRYGRSMSAGEGIRLRPNRSGPLSAAARTSRTNKRRRRLHICKRLSTFWASIRRGLEWVEEARLESPYTSQGVSGVRIPSSANSLPMRREPLQESLRGFLFLRCGFLSDFRMAAGRISVSLFAPFAPGVCRWRGGGGAFDIVRKEKWRLPLFVLSYGCLVLVN